MRSHEATERRSDGGGRRSTFNERPRSAAARPLDPRSGISAQRSGKRENRRPRSYVIARPVRQAGVVTGVSNVEVGIATRLLMRSARATGENGRGSAGRLESPPPFDSHPRLLAGGTRVQPRRTRCGSGRSGASLGSVRPREACEAPEPERPALIRAAAGDLAAGGTLLRREFSAWPLTSVRAADLGGGCAKPARPERHR